MTPQLSTEPLLGWRVWHVLRRGDDYRLRSWSRGIEWPAAERLEAHCRRHHAPGRGHRCGIYALRTRELAEALLPPFTQRRPVALGLVSLWGRVIENVGGWRAQYAYPYELFVVGGDEATVRGLRNRYGVDVSTL